MALESIESKILSRIKKCGRGNLLFASDFVLIGEQKSIIEILRRVRKTVLRIRPTWDCSEDLKIMYPMLNLHTNGGRRENTKQTGPSKQNLEGLIPSKKNYLLNHRIIEMTWATKLNIVIHKFHISPLVILLDWGVKFITSI